MSEHTWKTDDRAIYDFVRKLGDGAVSDLVGGPRLCTIIGWDDSERCYLVRFDNPRWGLYGHGLGVATGEYLRPIPPTFARPVLGPQGSNMNRPQWKTSEKTNTRLRNAVMLRPVVAELARKVEASFARHDGDEAKTAWTGDETAYGFLYRLMLTARYAEDTPRDHTAVIRKALVRCGAWVALALSLLDEEEGR